MNSRKGLIISTLVVVMLGLLLVLGGCSKDSAKADTPTTSNNAANVKVEVLDIGQGDAILIRTKEQNILIDTGDVYDEKHQLHQGGTTHDIVKMLKDRNITTIDKMIITHPHGDHLGGAVRVMQNFKVKHIYDNGELATSKVYRDYLKERKNNKNVESYTKLVSDNHPVLDFGDGVKFEVLSPTSKMIELGNTSKDKQYNNNSIVGKLVDGKFTMLLTGDAEKETEAKLVKEYGDKLQSVVLKSGHHGSRTSSSLEFLNKVRPAAAVISCGENSQYHHPHKETLKNYAALGIQIYATNGNNKFPEGDNGNTIVVEGSPEGLISITKKKE